MKNLPGGFFGEGGLAEAAPGQARLWFLAQLYPSSPAYNEPIMVRCDEPLDTAALTRALTEIIRRHQSWRTVFHSADGRVYQRVLPPAPFPLSIVDLRQPGQLDESQREAAAMQHAASQARQPFDLCTGPLVRGCLLRVADNDERLVITAHHIVVDGLSYFQVFLPELHALYTAFRAAQDSPLPELPMQYRDYASWHRAEFTHERLAPQLAYWKEQLAHAPPGGMDVPTDHARGLQPAQEGARHPLALSAQLTDALRALSRSLDVSLFTVVLAAWQTLLYRYTGQSDTLVGTAVSGRRQPSQERLIGFFSNNLVLRTQLDVKMPFAALCQRTKVVLQAAREHQDVPFELLVQHLGISRAAEDNPLFNTMCIVMPKAQPLPASPRWEVSRFDIGTAKLDLYLELHQRPEGLSGHLEYRTDLFHPHTIVRLAGHLQTLLAAAAEDSAQPLGRLAMLTAAEQRELAVFQGDSALPERALERPPLPQLFEQQAARTPDAIALVFQDQQISFAQLNARANQLARFLRSQGTRPDSLVGLCLDRSPEMIVGILGVGKAGGAYVPLDVSYPAERLRFMLEDTQAPLVLTTSRLRAVVPPGGARVLCLDTDWPAIAAYPDTDPEPAARAEHLAYVIYTSGSTGQPKGVLVEHRGVSNLAQVHQQLLGLGPGGRVLQFSSYNFDVSVGDLVMTLATGATLVLAPRQSLIPGAELAELLRTQKISVLALPPSALSALPSGEYKDLSMLLLAGEACPAELVSRWAAGRRFFNAYGPTEATVYATIAECVAGPQAPAIGRPLQHVQCFILDGNLEPLPVGVPGELYIGGIGVARGYLHRPELTAERFVSSPAFCKGSSRLYRTGDRVRWRPDGNIEFLGRLDRQVKLRGFRIELGEIEALLLQRPEVREAAVVLREDPAPEKKIDKQMGRQLDKQLVAYLALHPPATADLFPELLRWLREKLPAYMIPSRLVGLAQLPRSRAGKIDHGALPPAWSVPVATARGYEAPHSAIEQIIVTAWQQVLGRSGIGVHDNFFDLGGHSLRLAAVQSCLQEALARPVPMLLLFRHPTVRELALHLSSPSAPTDSLDSSQSRAQQQRAALFRARNARGRGQPHE